MKAKGAAPRSRAQAQLLDAQAAHAVGRGDDRPVEIELLALLLELTLQIRERPLHLAVGLAVDAPRRLQECDLLSELLVLAAELFDPRLELLVLGASLQCVVATLATAVLEEQDRGDDSRYGDCPGDHARLLRAVRLYNQLSSHRPPAFSPGRRRRLPAALSAESAMIGWPSRPANSVGRATSGSCNRPARRRK